MWKYRTGILRGSLVPRPTFPLSLFKEGLGDETYSGVGECVPHLHQSIWCMCTCTSLSILYMYISVYYTCKSQYTIHVHLSILYMYNGFTLTGLCRSKLYRSLLMKDWCILYSSSCSFNNCMGKSYNFTATKFPISKLMLLSIW